MVTGVFITLLGLWLLLTDSYTPSTSSSSSPISPSTISLAVLVTGMLTVTVSFLACCGSMVSSSCLLGTFLTLIITIIVGEVALGVALYTEEIDLRLVVSIVTREVVEHKYDSNNTLSLLSWDAVQRELECCGSSGPLDWATSNFNGYSKFTKEIGIRADFTSRPFTLPSSCCRFADDPKCNSSILPQFKTVINPHVYYTEGCSSSLMSLIEGNTLIVLAGIAILLLVELLAVIFSCCLCCRVKKKSTTRV